MFEAGVEATFIPGDPPRASRLALWRPDAPMGDDEFELVVPAGSSVRRRQARTRAVRIAEVLDELAELRTDADVTASVRAWSVASRLAIDLIARGRLLPARSRAGHDAWRVGPLDVEDAERRRMLADALPPAAHALVASTTPRLQVWHPSAMVDAFFDTVADWLPRTATAAQLSATHGAREPVVVDSPWLDTLVATGASVGLRLDVDEDERMVATVTIQSLTDPSLVLDAATLWDSPETVQARFGSEVDTELLVTLRRGARVWSPIVRLLDEARPERLVLADDEAEELFGSVADDLASAGIVVLWPSDVFKPIEVRPVISTKSPPGVTSAHLTLDVLAEMRWTGTVDGEQLSEQELEDLAQAKRPVVRVRGRWVRADPERLERLRHRRRLGTGSALAAALGGTTFVDGAPEHVDVEGPLAELAARLSDASGDRELEEPHGVEATLRPYQRRGLAWLVEMCELGLGGVLADDMGLGKTLQVLALHVHRKAGPTLVVCPASVIGNWEREAHRFVPAVPVVRFHGTGRTLDELAADALVITTYATLRRDIAEIRRVRWGLVVADEAQAIKNPYARVSRAIRTIESGVRVALTGTPVENHLGDLWAILDWTTPGLLGPLETFRREMALPIQRQQDPHVTDLVSRLVRPFLLRRRKVDPGVAPDLPPKIETDELMPLTSEQATLYRATVADVMARIEEADGMDRRGLVLKLLTGLKQICNHPAQFLGQPGPLADRSGKLEGLSDLVEVIADEGDATLLFTQFVGMGRLLDTHLGGMGLRTRYLHGSVPVKRRMEMVDEFQNGDVDVFVISLKAGGTGLNLTRANHVIHYDRWWNPAVEDQASDRAWRIGQDRTVQVHRMVCEGTVEDRIAELLAKKRALAEAVVGSGEGWITELSDADLAALVALGGDV